ncbi:hypothetical protein OIV83_002114 [Microbotryomycetes sp. JL201]|nr:hypothetical protein OIV83_002114 [Microbotryomycetes sp. JL201]
MASKPDQNTLVQPSVGGTAANPAPTTGAGSGTVGNPQSNDIGQKAGSAISGVFGAIHGAGEAIRGTINSTLDSFGDSLAGREQGSVASRSSNNPQEGQATAQKGVEEMRQGYEQVTGKH